MWWRIWELNFGGTDLLTPAESFPLQKAVLLVIALIGGSLHTLVSWASWFIQQLLSHYIRHYLL